MYMEPNRTALLPTLLMTITLTACSGDNSDQNPVIGGDEVSELPENEVVQSMSEEALRIQDIFQDAASNGYTGTALVRIRGEIVLHAAAGFADRELEISNTTETVFDMGSITKQYTGALIMTLQEAGLLQVEDTLADYLINVPEDKAGITIHQLLTHTAGFRSALGFDSEAIGREDSLERAFATPLQFEPGSRFGYSNVGYSIAAAIAETVSGQSYEELLNERLFAPAGMAETGYLFPDFADRSIALGYNARGQSFESRSIWGEEGPYWHLNGNGGLLTTTSDMLKWHDALSGVSVLSASSLEAIQGRHIDVATDPDSDDASGEEFYGYGWSIFDTPQGDALFHDGGNGFHLALFARLVDEDLAIILLANEETEAAGRLLDNIIDIVLPDGDEP